MSASPFRTTSGPFVEIPVPVVSDSLSDSKKNLEDVPFEAEIHDFPAVDGVEGAVQKEKVARPLSWFQRLFHGS